MGILTESFAEQYLSEGFFSSAKIPSNFEMYTSDLHDLLDLALNETNITEKDLINKLRVLIINFWDNYVLDGSENDKYTYTVRLYWMYVVLDYAFNLNKHKPNSQLYSRYSNMKNLVAKVYLDVINQYDLDKNIIASQYQKLVNDKTLKTNWNVMVAD